MDTSLFRRIVEQLLPEMGDPTSRKAWVEGALYGCAVLHRIRWEGAAYPFTSQLVRLLDEYGESAPGRPAVITLLEFVKGQVGFERQAQITQLSEEYLFVTQGGQMETPLNNAMLIGFLLEVGRWAMSELGERWKLRRAQQITDLTNPAQVEQTVTAQLQAIVAEKGRRDVSRVATLIERRRDAIDRARHAKLADREEYDQQRLTRSAFEQRAREHDATIQQMMDQIGADLGDLGFEVIRERA